MALKHDMIEFGHVIACQLMVTCKCFKNSNQGFRVNRVIYVGIRA